MRTLLILAAVVGVALGLDGMRRRRAYCLECAGSHCNRLMFILGGDFAFDLVDNAVIRMRGNPRALFLNSGDRLREPTAAERVAAEDDMARRSPHYAWHLEWARRFERAASRPWEAIPIDPPEPEDLWNVAECHFM